MRTKYFERIEADQEHSAREQIKGLAPFDFETLAAKGLRAWLARLAFRLLPAALWLARELLPVARLGRLYVITRREDVIAALENPNSVGVPYGLEMRELAAPRDPRHRADFVLGVDGAAQQRQNKIIRTIVSPEADLALAREWSAAFAQSLIEGGGGRLDVITDFIIRIPTEICRRYFGLSFANPNSFAEWSMAVSALLFADPFGDPKTRQLGLAGAARLNLVIDAAIERAERSYLQSQRTGTPLDEPTLVKRLVALKHQDTDRKLGNDEIRAILLGLVVGFIPTNGLGAANMLDALLARPRAWELAQAAASAGDKDAMQRILLEAGRLNPALTPGQWRYAREAFTVGEGKWYARKIPQGATIMVSTMSAMRDRRSYDAPGAFDPDAENDASLIFGHASHACLGKHLALGIITEMFTLLFAQPGLKRAPGMLGEMRRAGAFPRRLDMVYESMSGTQTMILLCMPVEGDVRKADLERELDALGNPARPDIRQMLDATGILHFASCSVVNAGEGEDGPLNLLIELNVDGPPDRALEVVAEHAGPWLSPIVSRAMPGEDAPLVDILRRYRVELHFWPWGATGLNFVGTGEFPVSSIQKQAELRAEVESHLKAFLTERGPDTGLGLRAMQALASVRRAIRMDRANLRMDSFLVQPSRNELALSKWRPPKMFLSPLRQVLADGLGVKLAAIAFVTALGFLLAAHYALGGNAWLSPRHLLADLGALWAGLRSFDMGLIAARLGHVAVIVTLALVMTFLFWAAILLAAYGIFRWMESREPTDDHQPDLARLKEIAARENSPGYRQNHIIAVTPLKRGIVRRLALAFALWGIRQSLFWFRPGFVVSMGTIHYAKWFRMPGSRKLIFQSNYDGSWESYLEDFITRAHPGQTAAWSNGEGFPKASNLIEEGARDGDRFKRWVRRQQIPTSFWYSRFPELTCEEIRTNALIHDGLANAQTDTAARAWLDLVGSAQRQPYELESTEIQSIVFRGLKKALFTACIPLKLPPESAGRGYWLDAMLNGVRPYDGEQGEILGGAGDRLSFGKFPAENEALYLALSASGLGKFARDATQADMPVDLVGAFPAPFAVGMANRGKVLGDGGPDDVAEPWRWSDASRDGRAGEVAADAVLLVYAPDTERLEAKVAHQRSLLDQCGGKVIGNEIRTVTLDAGGSISRGEGSFSYEHFGFRDGVTTPIIRGTEQFTPRGPAEDVVEPGEFILGYRNGQGYFAPSIMVPASSDTGENLPVAAEGIPFGFADFGNSDAQFAPRDFGRNGTYIVIRQLDQNKAGFARFVAGKADELNAQYSAKLLRETVGRDVDAAWVAAKMMGRWQSGRPLVGNPHDDARFIEKYPDNSFSYGRDDPRGHACPLGAHIRRTNPRDSLVPDDPLERSITRRHSLIRRGRAYFYDPRSGDYPVEHVPEGAETGLLFVALCADLERQFEFVQQTWAGFPSFQGLSNEPDPIATRRRHRPDEPRQFTIPTASGPLVLSSVESFVDLRGGGYFFLPSRSALRYLINLSQPEPLEPMLAALAAV